MAGVATIAHKEFGDIIRSKRFIILEAMLLLLLLVAIYAPTSTGFMGFVAPIRTGSASSQQKSFLGAAGSGFQGIISFLGPILGIALAVSAITGEREKGTMKMLLSQPIFRDNVLNGKFLAIASAVGVGFILAYVFFIGAAIMVVGVTPTLDEAFRLLLMISFSALYTLVFAAIALLVSVLTRGTTTAVLVALGVFALFTFALPLISSPIASVVAGPAPQSSFVVVNETTQVLSPGYREALTEYNRKLSGIMELIQSVSPSYHIGIINNFLQTLTEPQQTPWMRGQSVSSPRTYTVEEALQVIGVNITALALYMSIPFIVAYMIFSRQEEK